MPSLEKKFQILAFIEKIFQGKNILIHHITSEIIVSEAFRRLNVDALM